ncbi:toxin-antitoxin system YwqK family antitoxin [Luteibaculum oceani]|uniref:Toxin-antitoxin system YwqK family antitoxin n=1 Tax=Luteibaculum oceani TaxID=1294296 RepID=A0A5C6UWU0_9FLAO|nr:hypothetical protein [Luteibaculum oceani]TXC77050.1 hypothetical protein FRX97_09295 [Luteibaculum oceani]
MIKLSLVVALVSMGFANGYAQGALAYDQVMFAKDKILDLRTGLPYSGRLEEKYSNGKLKWVSLVKDGKLIGSTKGFYPSGQTHFILTYEDGDLTGVFTEYFSNGELKFQGDISRQSRYGGNDMRGFLYCYYDGDRYKNKYKGKGRIQLMTANGLSPFFNGHMSPNLIEGYRVFENKMVNYGMFIEDSREIVCPEARDPQLSNQNWSPN